MLFSVVVPVYNVEKYLLECLNSIANQTFDDYEVILVDDGSTDSSGKICDEFCATHDKFKVFHKQNEGLLKTRLFGRTKMNGEYMISIDSDDFIANNSFEILKNYIEKYDRPDVICFNKYIYQDDKIAKPQNSITDLKIYSKECKKDFLYETFFTTKYNNLVTKIIKTSLLLLDDTDYSVFCANQGEDITQSLYSIVNSNTIVVITDFLYYYRQNQNSITHSYISIDNVEKYNLRKLHELKLFYIKKSGFSNQCIYKIIAINIEYCVNLFMKTIVFANNKKILKEIINYNWSSFFLKNGKFNRKELSNTKIYCKLMLKFILNKNVHILLLISKIYKMKFQN